MQRHKCCLRQTSKCSTLTSLTLVISRGRIFWLVEGLYRVTIENNTMCMTFFRKIEPQKRRKLFGTISDTLCLFTWLCVCVCVCVCVCACTASFVMYWVPPTTPTPKWYTPATGQLHHGSDIFHFVCGGGVLRAPQHVPGYCGGHILERQRRCSLWRPREDIWAIFQTCTCAPRELLWVRDERGCGWGVWLAGVRSLATHSPTELGPPVPYAHENICSLVLLVCHHKDEDGRERKEEDTGRDTQRLMGRSRGRERRESGIGKTDKQTDKKAERGRVVCVCVCVCVERSACVTSSSQRRKRDRKTCQGRFILLHARKRHSMGEGSLPCTLSYHSLHRTWRRNCANSRSWKTDSGMQM